MPQDQNSGGFYLSLFRKAPIATEAPLEIEPTKQEIEEAEKEALALEDGEELQEDKPKIEAPVSAPANANAHPKKEKKNSYQVKSDTKFLPLPEVLWEEIKSDFGISAGFPRHLLHVGSEKNKTIYLVTEQVANYLKNDSKEAIKLIIFGTPIFQKSRAEANTPNSYRISQGGIRFVYPYMTKNVIKVTFDELKFFLNSPGSVSNDDLLKEPTIDGKKFADLPKNSYCLVYNSGNPGDDDELFMVSKMERSVATMVPKEDVAGLKIKFKLV